MTKSTIDIDIEHTKLTNHVPTQLPTGTGTTVHSTLSIHNSYNMYIHNMPRDTPPPPLPSALAPPPDG